MGSLLALPPLRTAHAIRGMGVVAPFKGYQVPFKVPVNTLGSIFHGGINHSAPGPGIYHLLVLALLYHSCFYSITLQLPCSNHVLWL